jgi:hypothetical protein
MPEIKVCGINLKQKIPSSYWFLVAPLGDSFALLAVFLKAKMENDKPNP